MTQMNISSPLPQLETFVEIKKSDELIFQGKWDKFTDEIKTFAICVTENVKMRVSDN